MSIETWQRKQKRLSSQGHSKNCFVSEVASPALFINQTPHTWQNTGWMARMQRPQCIAESTMCDVEVLSMNSKPTT